MSSLAVSRKRGEKITFWAFPETSFLFSLFKYTCDRGGIKRQSKWGLTRRREVSWAKSRSGGGREGGRASGFASCKPTLPHEQSSHFSPAFQAIDSMKERLWTRRFHGNCSQKRGGGVVFSIEWLYVNSPSDFTKIIEFEEAIWSILSLKRYLDVRWLPGPKTIEKPLMTILDSTDMSAFETSPYLISLHFSILG